MTTSLWEVSFQSRQYSSDYEDVTVCAPNPKAAIQAALKKMGGHSFRRLQEIEQVKLLGRG